jgi:hypothetical protein
VNDAAATIDQQAPATDPATAERDDSDQCDRHEHE